jgi:Phosphotransferase system mannitol/fructose-specific IIA domain (Ntr-type)
MDTVFYQLKNGVDKYEAFREIVSSCSIFHYLRNREEFLNRVIEREEIQTTGMGHGVAIAHGKIEGIGKPIVALGFSRDGIKYDNVFPEPVHLLFVIASDPVEQNEYIKAVSSILSWVHDVDFRDDIQQHLTSERAKSFLSMLLSRSFHPLQRG